MTDKPAPQITDVAANAQRVIDTTKRFWALPGIDDSTPKALGMSPLEIEKLHNGGLTDEQIEQINAATGSVRSR